jgi:hypothetical protein
MAKGCISWVDEDGNETFIEHPRAVELPGGFYVVEDFKRVKRSEKAVKKLLDAGKTVHYLNAYSGNSNPWDEEDYDLLFTGKIVWKNENLYAISAFAGGGMKLGKIPAGTLVVGISDDLVQTS